jgi:hypothetical protein
VGKNQAGLRVGADDGVSLVSPAKECCGRGRRWASPTR